ncbi:SDR family NAD(P)-dependent oxidoreductase [Actinoplanes sp. RD1]|uniref:SDR family NAD(P)-dependent oxidoreductase n=1 Tax=Actinoplanes sp. RD1 TaxID=3064538 RepID=UPI0027413B9F|nr:SDR family oxidoreductase [Actinoplanes sp. RD1]
MEDFKDRVALVTGAARGIGGGVADALAAAGATVMIGDILEPEGEAHAETLRAGGYRATFHSLDVRSEQAWQTVADTVRAEHGRLDMLVNSAGIMVPGGFEDVSFTDYRRDMQITVDSTFLSLKYLAPLLRQRTDAVAMASVVNVSSIAAFAGAGAAVSYAASRAAMLSLTRSAALDFAGRGYKIRVNSVHPGSVSTDLSAGMRGKLLQQGFTDEQVTDYMVGLHPLGRLGTVEDITAGVLYLLSDNASWVTGTSLTIDGGRTA